MHARLFSAGLSSVGHCASRILLLTTICCVPTHASELPWWVDSIEVSPPGLGGIGAVTLSGTWIDTGAPDAISHSILDGALHFSVSAPDLNVATGDALTPWTLTEEFGPLPGLPSGDPINRIMGSIFSVDPANRGVRQLVSGPDFLGWIVPPPRGEFHGLGTGEAYVSAAFDVSANGRVVVGASQLAPGVNGLKTSEAFAWSPATGKVSLGLLPGGVPGGSTAFGVSAEGNYVVGVSSTGVVPSIPEEAFRWSLGGGMEGLGTIHGASSTSEARAASRHGAVVVGVDNFDAPSFPGGSGRRAFRYTDESGMQDLGVPAEYDNGYGSSEAVDVSENGRVVVGTAHRGANPLAFEPYYVDQSQPFRWSPETGMQGLGNLPRVYSILPPPQQETVANAVSADGKTVVGVDRVLPPQNVGSTGTYIEESAVLWTRETGWIDLGRLKTPAFTFQYAAQADDVSGDGGLVIGSATLSTPCHACDCVADVFCGTVEEVPFLWDPDHGMRPLERVLSGDFGLDLTGWNLGEATAISDDGTTIVGTGINPDGVQEAWRAVLFRNTRIGDADFDGDVDLDDRSLLMAGYGMSSSAEEVYYNNGDFDEDGVVGHNDMRLFMANYDGRSLGDFNADGVVDAADYTVWRDANGEESGLADGDGDGRATEADLAIWRANYGRTLGSTGTPIPEPAAWTLVLSAIAVTPTRRRSFLLQP